MNLPLPAPLDSNSVSFDIPYVIDGNEAFPLYKWFLRSDSGTQIPEEYLIFDFRLSSAQRYTENAFVLALT